MYKSCINRVLSCIIQFAINKSTKKGYLLMNYDLQLNIIIILFNSVRVLITFSIPVGESSANPGAGLPQIIFQNKKDPYQHQHRYTQPDGHKNSHHKLYGS